MVFQNDILAGASGADGGYEIEYSARLTVDNSFLKATTDFNGSGNTQYWTVSFWAKRADLTKTGILHSSTVGGSTYYQDRLGWNAGANLNKIVATYGTNASAFTSHISSGVYRDPSAWAHYCIQNNNFGVTVWVNNEVALSFTHGGSYRYLISSSYDYRINSHEYQSTPNGTTDWYIADYYLILDSSFGASDIYGPDQFGEYNDDGVWVPKENSLTTAQFGEDGCFMEFKQSGTSGATASDIGADTSGQDNHMQLVGTWTSDDQVTDTPTDNAAVFNPLFSGGSYVGGRTISDGNLVFSKTGGGQDSIFSTIAFNAEDDTYAEFVLTTAGGAGATRAGIQSADNFDIENTAEPNLGPGDSYGYGQDGAKYGQGVYTPSWGASFTSGDVIGVRLNNGSLYFYKNGTEQGGGAAWTGITGNWYFGVGGESGCVWTARFPSGVWTQTPSGVTSANSLTTANLPAPTIKDGSAYFQATIYTGAGYPTEVNQSGNSTFQPDFVWVKRRNGATRHDLFDAVRGGSSILESNDTRAENIVSGALTFDSDGFTAAADPIFGDTGSSGNTFVGWQWLAANGTASNTDGSITSTVSANTTAGFSVIGYTGNATSGATIGHGLGVAPAMVITKSRDNGTGRNWAVYHAALGPTKYLELDNTNLANVGSTRWNDTAPSSTVITLGSQQTTNDSGAAMIAYAFAEVEGFSKFGKYTGNGSLDGPFVWCGFRPSFLMVKRTDVASDWFMLDNQRPGYNVIGGGGVGQLPANQTYAESTLSTYAIVDFLSNGFKVRHDMTYGYWNASGGTYIFMAFAEHPFGGDGVAPVPAR